MMTATEKPDDFHTLLAEVGGELIPPPGFVPCPVRENSVCAYQYALRSPGGELELRYRIDSFARLEAERRAICAEMEMLASASLNNMYEANYTALLFNLSEGAFPMPNMLPPAHAAVLFGADRAALCFVRMAARDFSPDYDTACVFGFHKENMADAYIIGLYKRDSGAEVFFDEPPEWRFV